MVIGSLLRGTYAALSFLPPLVPLALLSALAGVGILLVFRKTSDPMRIRSVKRLLQAHLLEMRLFRDEPRVVWKAQKALLLRNAQYVALMLRPALWVALPLMLLFFHLEAFHGRMPLPVGRDAIVTVGLKKPIDASRPAPVLTAPAGIVVVTPPVRVLANKEISWRIRPDRASVGAPPLQWRRGNG